MSYDKKVQNGLNNNVYSVSKQKVLNNVSNNEVQTVQNKKSTAPLDTLADNEFVDINIDENNNSSTSANVNNKKESIDENNILIKQLEAEISKLEAEYKASQKGKGIAGSIGGFFSSCWNGIKGNGFKNGDKVELDNKIALLEAAKADPSKLAEAYKEIMGAELTDEVRQNAIESENLGNNLSTEEKQEIINSLKNQAASLSQLMEQTKDNQGWFSKAMGGINNIFGFGTNSIKADAKIEEFVNQVNLLDPNDPDFAAKYQALTGEALSLEGIEELSQGVSKVGNSPAAEAIMDYEETQAAAKEIGVGIVTGVVVAAGVIAAPFTGGASLAATVAFSAALGGATTVLINGTDTIGTDKKYSLEQGLLDFGGGAINGAVTAMTLGGAGLAGKGFSALKGAGSASAKATAKQMVSGGFKNTAKSAFNGFGKAALRGAKIATFSSASNYLLNTVGTNAIYEMTGNYTKSETPANIIQNEDGTYSVYYELTDSNTGDVISYEIETVDSLSKDKEGNLIKGNVLSTSRSNDFNFKDLAKQTAISAGTAALGAGIGKVTNNIINPYATSITNSVVVGNAAEIASDMTLSLSADYLIASAQAGKFIDKDEFFSWDRILGEGRNQIRGLLIGIASSKVNGVDTTSVNAVRSGFDGKTSIDITDIPTKTGGDIDATNIKSGAEVTIKDGTSLPAIKLDNSELPKTQQEIITIAGRLILEENNPARAGELLSSCGMSETEITKFFEDAIAAKQVASPMAVTKVAEVEETTEIDSVIKAIQTPQNGTIRSAEDLSVEDITKLYSARMNIVSEDNIANMLSKYSSKGNEQLARSILANMGQYADLDGFNSLYKQLSDSKITLITDKDNTSLGDVLSYLSNKQAFPRDITVQADDIKSGIKKVMQESATPGLILDASTIAVIKNDTELQDLIRSNPNVKLVLLDGYNKGITAFNHSSSADVEQKLDTIFKEVKKLVNEGYSEQDVINKVLNGDIIKDFEELGLAGNIQIIKNESSQDTLDNSQISHLYSSKQITNEQIEEILSNYATEDRQYVLEILAQTSKPSSMSTLSAQTKKQFANIQNMATQKGVDTENIYYLVPTVEMGSGKKSYGMVSTIYRDSNGIPVGKFISDISQVPDAKNSMVVILDDFSGSGKSLIDNYRAITNPEEIIREQITKQAKKQFEKGVLLESEKAAWIESKIEEELAQNSSTLIPYNSSLKKFDGEILIAPLASTTGEGSAIVNFAKYTEADPKLTFMPSDEIPLFMSSDYMKSLPINDQRTFQQILKPFDTFVRFDPEGDKASKWQSPNDEFGYFGFRGNATSIAFPYMAPNNNNAFYSTFVAPKLTFNSAGIKNRWIMDSPVDKICTHIVKNTDGEDAEYIQEVKGIRNENDEITGSEIILKVNGKCVETYRLGAGKKAKELTPAQIQQIQKVRESYATAINKELNEKFTEAYAQFLKVFEGIGYDVNDVKKNGGNIYENSGNIMYGRPKTIDSLGDKLVNKIKKGDNIPDINAAREKVEDGIGTRLIMDKIDEESIQKITNKLCEEIKKYNIVLTEINNYRGEDLSPYFTDAQIEQIRNTVLRAREEDTEHKFYPKGLKDFKTITGTHEKAVKASGYTAFQMNVIYKNGALGEIQIRGREMDQLAEVEHIPYDTRQGKQLKPKYDSVVQKIKALNDEAYKEYENYWRKMYEYAVKKERGIPWPKPKLPEGIPKEISYEALQKI
ncbi:hypothetical protein IJC60_05815 [bacterium]|nr:hypothetical protein [bacterium]